MNKIFVFFCFFMLNAIALWAQPKIERKIIIQNNEFYFFTIDEESQLATLYNGDINQKLNLAKRRLFPIGRDLSNEFNPMAFDIFSDQFVGVNWMLNTMNSRYEAIKEISIKNWSKSRPEWTTEDWAQVSFIQPIAALNEPWEKMLEENNVIQNCYFDLIKTNEIVMAITNNGKLWMSTFDGKNWTLRAKIPVEFDAYFSIFYLGQSLFGLIDAKGAFYKWDVKSNELSLVTKSIFEKPSILIIDKDKNKVYSIPAEAVEAGAFMNLSQLISQSAQQLN